MKDCNTRPDWAVKEGISKLVLKMTVQVEMEMRNGVGLKRAITRAIHDNLMKHVHIIQCVNRIDRSVPTKIAEDNDYIEYMQRQTLHKMVDELPKSGALLKHEYDSGYERIYHYLLATFVLEDEDDA